jgi:hypothetical protein
MERLRKEGAALVYRFAKQRSEPTSDKRGAKVDELHLTPLELIDRIAALVTVVMHSGATGSKSSQTGIWRRNRHLTMRSTDKSIGEGMKRRIRLAAGRICARRTQHVG